MNLKSFEVIQYKLFKKPKKSRGVQYRLLSVFKSRGIK